MTNTPQPNNLNASDDTVKDIFSSLWIDISAKGVTLMGVPEAKAAINQHIQEEVRRARIDEWHLITDYIESSFSFDWYPADFKAYRDKRIAELQRGQE